MEAIDIVRRKHAPRLLNLPNVIGLGVCDMEGRRVIKVIVTEKVPELALKTSERVPKLVEGFRTRVVVG